MGPAESINLVEVALREFIEHVLVDKFGRDEWIKACGTPDKIERWRDRRTEEGKRREGIVTEERLLYFSDFTDLAPVVRKHWDLFKPCFGDRKTFDVYMDRLEEFRNAPMHARKLVPFERSLVDGMAGELRNKITIYRSEATALDKRFPRIEFARDSFGRTRHGEASIDDPSITLHPGDEVIFELSGCDPLGGDLRWEMRVYSPGETIKAAGADIEFRWLVTEEQIGEHVFAELHLISDRKWHRHTGYDDAVIFAYTVLPRRAM